MAKTRDMNLMKLTEMFHSDERCRSYLEALRWPDGLACLRCGSILVSRSYKRNQFVCDACSYNFSVTSGTIFHDTHLPLPKWFVAIYLMCESKKGISANQMKRTLDVAYKTAWYLCHRIRAAMAEVNPRALSGTVEVDETWVGGRQRGVGSGNRGGKSVVVGAVERDGAIRLNVVNDRTRQTLHAFIRQHVDPATERIITDEWYPYRGIGDHDTTHETVNHFLKEYVRGDVHTNTVENVWSLLKRSIVGSYHKVSEKHLDAYLDELEWRFNNRKNPWLFRDTLLKLLNSENLTYVELVR
ncbi:MAG: IS1595 family transposase [Candidatus Binatia bacterium]